MNNFVTIVTLISLLTVQGCVDVDRCVCLIHNTVKCSFSNMNITEMTRNLQNISDTPFTLRIKDANFGDLQPDFFSARVFKDIRILKLEGCIMNSTSANTFQNLEKTRYLYLTENSIQMFDPDTFRGMQSIARLVINGNNFKYFIRRVFENVQTVQWLEICENNLLQDLPQNVFHKMNELIVLNLMYNGLKQITNGGVWNGLGKLQQLYLNGNDISVIADSAFSPLTSLQHLGLTNNDLDSLPRYAFAGLRNLNFLNLRYNEFYEVPSAAISTLTQLAIFDLDFNRISHISANAFANLTNLQEIRLTRNRIKSIDEKAFLWLPLVNKLYLNGNRMVRLPGNVFKSLGHQNQSVTINLFDNSWFCDCYMADFIQWLNGITPEQAEQLIGLVCKGPSKLFGLEMSKIPYNNLTCYNTIYQITHDNNNTLVFIISGCVAMVIVAIAVGVVCRKLCRRKKLRRQSSSYNQLPVDWNGNGDLSEVHT